jgi:hypothetical protein
LSSSFFWIFSSGVGAFWSFSSGAGAFCSFSSGAAAFWSLSSSFFWIFSSGAGAFWIFSSSFFCNFSSAARRSLSSFAAGGGGMRTTFSAIRSASCSNLSPGLFTSIFACTAGGAAGLTGEKKLPPPARAMNALLADRETVDLLAVEDFSAADFMSARCQFLHHV